MRARHSKIVPQSQLTWAPVHCSPPGISTERKYIALEWITAVLAALLYAFCAWLAVYWGIMLLGVSAFY